MTRSSLALTLSLTLTCLLVGAPADAATFSGKIRTSSEADPADPDEKIDVVHLETSQGALRLAQCELADVLYRFRGKNVQIDAQLAEGLLTPRKILYPVFREGIARITMEGRRYKTPQLSFEGSAAKLKVEGRCYFLAKRLDGKRVRVRGWVFDRTKEVWLADVEGKINTDTILTRVLVSIKGRVKKDEIVWAQGLSLFRYQVLVKKQSGNFACGHVLNEQIEFGLPEPAEAQGKQGLAGGVTR